MYYIYSRLDIFFPKTLHIISLLLILGNLNVKSQYRVGTKVL